MLNKKVVFISSDTSGCGWYRTKLIADYLNQDHIWFFPAHKEQDGSLTLKDERILNADVIVIQRHNHEFFLQCIPYLQSLGKKIVYDLDDNLWHIPSVSPASKFFSSSTLKLTKKIIQMCDYVTVSTQPLKEYLFNNGFNKNIVVIPNMLNKVFPYKEKNNERIRIGYSGSPTHVGDFSFRLCDALRTLKKTHNVELVFMGYNPIRGAEDEYIPGVEVSDYLDKLNALNLDIAIAPLDNCIFNQCKSNLKFLEYSACGIATIASNVYPYSKTIQHDLTGVLVSDERNWLPELTAMVESKTLRRRISDAANEYVEWQYTYDNAGGVIADKWESIIKELYVNS